MKMTKKALTAMIAASIAATTLPAAAMVSNLSTLTSSNSAGTNNATPQDANTSPQTDTPATEEPNLQSAAATPAVQATPSPESMFQVESSGDGVVITGFITTDPGFRSSVVVPDTIGGKKVKGLKSTNLDESSGGYGGSKKRIAMDGAKDSATPVRYLDLSNCTSPNFSIGDGVFRHCYDFKGFNPPASYFNIGIGSFESCPISAVDLTRCTYIDANAFSANHSLQSLDLSQSQCTKIERFAFQNCTNLTFVNLPTNHSYTIGIGAFSSCFNLKTIDLSKCDYIDMHIYNTDLKDYIAGGIGLFENCTDLTSVIWPTNKIATIPYRCFSGCGNLNTFNSDTKTEINLSDITSVEKYAFQNCTGITSVTLPTEHPYTLANNVFSGCSGITSVDLSNCNSIGNSAFAGCRNITSVDLSGCTSVGESAFNGCSGITDVTWSSTQNTILDNCFNGCTSLKTFNGKTEGEFNLSNITSIGNFAFNGCTSITGSINLSSCISVGNSAFANCSNITGPIDLSKCTSIGDSAFSGCTNINPVISIKAETVGSGAFKDCPYVAIQADTEEELINYCAGIAADSGNLKGLSNVKKVATLSNPAGVSVAPDDIANHITLDSGSTYYISASRSDYTKNNYQTTAYDIALKSVANGASEATAIAGNIPLTIQIPADQYDQDRTYYLSTDTANPINLTEQDGYYTYNYIPTLSAADTNTIAIVSPNVTSITVSGDNAFTYNGNIIIAEYTAAVKPDDAKQSVTWSSDNENVLKFSDPNSGTATIVGAGETTVTATATDGSGITKTSTITVNKATPTITLSDKKEDYTGSPIEMSGAEVTLVNNETYTGEITYTYYSDVDCKNQLEGAPTNAGTYYVKASIPEQDNYTAAESNVATLTITPIDMNDVTATSFNGSYDGQPHSISVTVTGQPEDANIKYYVGDYNTDQPEASEWKETPPEFTDVCNETISYKVTDPNGNYNEIKGIATLTITQVDVTAVPPAPEMESQTPDSITLKTVDGGTTEQGDAYSTQYGINVDGEITWQDNATFTGLTPGDHNFYLRYRVNEPKTGNYTNDGCSAPSEAATFIVNQLDPPTVGEGFTIDYVNETISLGAGYEAATDANFAAENMLNSGDKIQPGSTVYVRTAATGDAIASVGTPNAIASRPATPTVPNVVQTVNMLTVTNPGDQQEYKFDKAVNATRTSTLGQWQSSPVFTDNNMVAGDTYTVTTRIKATETTFASEEATTGTTTEAFPDKQETLKGDTNEAGEFVWTDSDGNDYTGSYDIPTRLLTTGGDTYMVEIDWGDMLFSYNFGTWDTETLSYDDPSKQGWTTSFDGVNNEVTVINRSSNAIESTIGLTVDADKQAELEHLGFHLTSDNKNSEDSNDYYPTEAKTLQRGSTGNSTTAYVNIKSDDTKPNDSIANKYNKEVDGTQIGNITVTVQKTANP